MKLVPLREVCIFNPPKSEARDAINPSDLVSFMPMQDLGIESKNAETSSCKPLNEVIKGYTYFAENDVLIAKITPCFENGKMGIARNLVNGIGFGSSEYFVLRSTDSVLSEYLYYFLRQEFVIENGRGIMTGAVGHRRVPGEYLENLEIPLPSLEKQREIVEKLDDAFAQLDLLEDNLAGQISGLAEITAEKLEQVFGGQTKSLTDFRALTLGEIARVINGRAYSQPELLKEGPYPVLRVGNFFSNRSWYYSDLELDKDKYCDNGDLLYAWSASFGPRIWDGGKVIYHYHIWKIEEKKDLVLRDWLYWWLLWDVNQIKKAHGTGSTMMHVTKGAMENRPIQLPSLTIQSQQLREITELQLATQKLDTNYKSLTENWSNLRNAILTSAFMEGVA
jgi:type I restriction enzyme S subunit